LAAGLAKVVLMAVVVAIDQFDLQQENNQLLRTFTNYTAKSDGVQALRSVYLCSVTSQAVIIIMRAYQSRAAFEWPDNETLEEIRVEALRDRHASSIPSS
jgi:hypothetical protein